MEINSPHDVVMELSRLRSLAERGVDAVFEAEKRLAECEEELDSAYARAFLRHDGNTVALREQLATLDVSGIRLQRDIARAELNRVKLKMKSVSDAMVAVSVIAKQVEIMWKG